MRVAEIVDKIEKADQRVSELETTLADPRTYSSSAIDVSALVTDLESAKKQAQELMMRWEQLEDKRQQGAS